MMFLSNRVEILFEFFRERLYAHKAPFIRRIVVVPSLAMKNWLVQRLAESSSKIAMGIEWYGLDESIAKLAEALTAANTQSIPTALEWSFAIENEFAQGLFQQINDPLWQPIRKYLNIDSHTQLLSKKGQKRAISLALQLGQLFSSYSLFGSEAVQKWSLETPHDWQEALWKNIRQKYPKWTDWHTLLHPSQPNVKPKHHLEVHFFSLSFIPTLFFQFLENIAAEIPISFYQLSPCQSYWEPILNSRESQWLQHQDRILGASEAHQDALEELLRDHNPLLANFGRLGREMSTLFEECSLPKETFYSLPQTFWKISQYEDYLYDAYYREPSEALVPSLLECIQADIVLMRNPADGKPVTCLEDDRSVRIVRAASPLREVQQLHDALTQQRIANIEAGNALLPQEILILVPDLSRYVPFIRCVFEEQETGFPIRILEWTLASQSPLIQAYLQLLSLADSRWDCGEIFQLLCAEAFCRKQNWTEEDLGQIKKWLEQANIWWGDTLDHRDEILLRNHCKQGMSERSETGTWQYGFERLLCGIALKNPVEGFPLPCSLENSKVPLLNSFLNCIHSLKDDLEPFVYNHTLTVADWCRYLNALFTSYLTPDETSIWDKEGSRTLEQTLEKLRRSTDLETLYPYESIKARLLELLASSESSHEEGNLAAIRIAGLLPMRTQPARFLAILGMDEESFPRRDPVQSLNKLSKKDFGDYFPSQSDSDRYLFLEVLMSARETLWISFTGFCNDGQEIPPSSLVGELLSFLEKSYQINNRPASEVCFITPPFHAHDSAHFIPNSIYPSFSAWRYRLASAQLFTEKACTAPYPKSQEHHSKIGPETVCLELKNWLQLARNPIEFHYRQQLGLYISEKNSQPTAQEHFLLPHLQHALLTKQALRSNLEHVMQDSSRQGIVPLGLFGSVEKLRILETSEPAQKWLNSLGVTTDSIIDVELSEAYTTLNREDPRLWKFPPLILTSSDGHSIKLVGKLEALTPQGILLNKVGKQDVRYECLPLLIILKALNTQFQLPFPTKILWAKELKAWEYEPHDTLMKKWTNYLFLAQKHPIPFLPKWISYFLKADVNGLQTKLDNIGEDNFELDYYSIEKWLWRGREKPSAQVLIEEWQSLALELFPQEKN